MEKIIKPINLVLGKEENVDSNAYKEGHISGPHYVDNTLRSVIR
jgi:hypothetical protein